MDVKSRILLMKEYLEENSDEEQSVSTPELIQYLKKKGCPVTVQTLRTDIRSLQKAGYDIEITEKEGMPTTYSWITRKWDEPELQILVDAVSSSQFITRKKSNELIRKLAGRAGPSTRKDLQPRILVSENIKAPNEQILYIVSGIRDAIRKDRKISFRYFHYDAEKKRVPTHEGTS